MYITYLPSSTALLTGRALKGFAAELSAASEALDAPPDVCSFAALGTEAERWNSCTCQNRGQRVNSQCAGV